MKRWNRWLAALLAALLLCAVSVTAMADEALEIAVEDAGDAVLEFDGEVLPGEVGEAVLELDGDILPGEEVPEAEANYYDDEDDEYYDDEDYYYALYDDDWEEEVSSISMNVCETRQLRVDTDSDGAQTWSSSNTKVATVKDGKVTGVSEGKCTITVRIDGVSLACEVSVFEYADLYEAYSWYDDEDYDSETPIRSATLDAGDTLELVVTYVYGRTVTWSSSDANVATVDDGVVTAVGEGKCNITARIGKKTFTCAVTVANDPAELYEYDDECYDDDEYDEYNEPIRSASLDIGDSLDLVVIYANGRKVTWTSSDSNVATVKNGEVKAVGPGKCTITARVGSATKRTCEVTVVDNSRLSATALSLYMGQSDTLTVRKRAGRAVTWSSASWRMRCVSER